MCITLHHNCRSSLMFVHYVFNQICIDAMLQSTSILFRCGVLSSFQSPICHNLSILCARRSLEALSPFNSFGENTFGLSSAELLFSSVVLGHGVSWYLASPGTWRSPLHLKKLPCLPWRSLSSLIWLVHQRDSEILHGPGPTNDLGP